ncbi:MAG: metal ABC transporter permease [Trueperaceae bacterium]|nr:metal ABC transporter permease [Truepera sp.]HRN18901.1 metal ABC transporter permease [Trueperaceae bacterium]HRQ09703.1 metal ABC transporter permease [Trueperaceae bacterium]
MAALFQSVPFAILGTGVLVAVASALVGTLLTVRGQAMLTDAISHGVVLGIAVVYLALDVVGGPWQLLGAAITGLITVFVTEALSSGRRVRRDAAIALVFPAMFAAGVLLLALFARNVHVDQHTVLLGEIGFVWLDQVSVFGFELPRAMATLALVLALDLAFLGLLYKQLAAAAFDPVHAQLQGLRPKLVGGVLLALTAVTAVAAFDAVGVVLFVAFAIVPAVTGQLLGRRLPGVLLIAAGIGTAAALGGYPVALALDISIGGTMALLTGVPLVILLSWRLLRAVVHTRTPSLTREGDMS